MIEKKFNVFNDNDTNCSYVTIRWNVILKNKVLELKRLQAKTNSNVEVEISFDFLYIFHLEEFSSINDCEKAFLGYNGTNYYIQLYFYPTQNNEVLSDEACISFDVSEDVITDALTFFEMEYQAALG